jgi:DNA processing protein
VEEIATFFRESPKTRLIRCGMPGALGVLDFEVRKERGFNEMTLKDAVALSCLQPVSGDTRAARLLKELVDGPPGLPFEPAVGELIAQLADRLGIPPAEQPAAITSARAWADRALARAEKTGLSAIPYADPRYPPWLKQIVDPPSVLWVRGSLPDLERPAVAVVGSRHATPTGLALGRQLGEGLAEAGLLVVSGLARGVDGVSHEGALAVGGKTLGVLGCGADVIYPAEHRDLTARVAASGGVISELPPGTTPQPHYFPLRNRIIAGLSRAVVVIEAGERSGSLITARMALEQGRDVLAVPGNVLSGRNRGCHALIKNGARLVETVGDVLDELGWARAGSNQALVDGKPLGDSPLDSVLESKMAAGETYDADGLVAVTGWATSHLLAELAALEIQGRLVRVPGGWIRRAGRQC